MDARILIGLFALVVAVVAKDVSLQKCCKMDEYLHKETNYTCAKYNGVKDWKVMYFDPEKSPTFLYSIPEGWLFQESVRPKCSKPMQISFNSATTYVVAANGSLFVPTLSSSVFSPNDYCLDYEAIVVCTPELTVPKVRKCCSDGFVYTDLKNTCVKGTEHYKVQLQEKGFAHVEAFPECEGDGNISLAVVGTMKESELFENGSILVQKSGLLLEAESFCLVNVLESPGNFSFIKIL